MRLYLQLSAGVVAALIATFLILTFKLYEAPVLLGGLLLIVCCAGPLLGIKGVSSPPPAAQPDERVEERPEEARPEEARPDEVSEPATEREEGDVKWFNISKGFGFIRRENGEEIFVHFRSIRGPQKGRRHLRDGQRVSFTVARTEKGPQAEDVEPIERKT